MKLSCSRSALAAAFQTVSGVIPNRTPKPILQNVKLETTDSGTVISGERAKYKLGAENPAEFPLVAEFDEQNSVTIAAGVLKQMIQRTVFATDTESTRYALGGVLVEIKGESIVMAATDTRRLAVMRGQCAASGKAAAENAVPVVPSKALALIER